VRESKACFLRFAVGKASETKRPAKSEALSELRGIENFSALPWPQTKKCSDARGVFCLGIAGEAVLTFVGRVEAGISLLDVGRLSENLPIDGLGCGIILLFRSPVRRPVQFSIEVET
jgi:hypothetical protein